MRKVMLTTVDNEINPFDDFANWFRRDVELGHNTCSFLARFSINSDSLSDFENERLNELVIDDIIANDMTKMYVKVVRDSADTDEQPPGGS